MKDFFISYTSKDENYATWIAEVLESVGYQVIIQAWDFRGGDNFVNKIDESLKECNKLLIVLSRAYLESKWCEAEWTSKIRDTVENGTRSVIPVRVEPVELKGLLSPVVYIDIVDKTEDMARQLLIDGIKEKSERVSKGFPPFYNVEYQEIDNDYSVFENEIVFIKRCKVRIKCSGTNSIHCRVTWFADETVYVEPIEDTFSIQYLDLHDTNTNYNVVFDRELKKDEIVEFGVKIYMSNINRHFNNFFSTEVITPIKRLDIHLNHIYYDVSSIFTQKISSSPMNTRTEKPEKHQGLLPFHWHIDNPELHFEYKIFW